MRHPKKGFFFMTIVPVGFCLILIVTILQVIYSVQVIIPKNDYNDNIDYNHNNNALFNERKQQQPLDQPTTTKKTQPQNFQKSSLSSSSSFISSNIRQERRINANMNVDDNNNSNKIPTTTTTATKANDNNIIIKSDNIPSNEESKLLPSSKTIQKSTAMATTTPSTNHQDYPYNNNYYNTNVSTSIIITCNLIPIHPSLSFIVETVQSLHKYLQALPTDTPIYIAMDHLNSRQKQKSTNLTLDLWRRQEYIQRLYDETNMTTTTTTTNMTTDRNDNDNDDNQIMTTTTTTTTNSSSSTSVFAPYTNIIIVPMETHQHISGSIYHVLTKYIVPSVIGDENYNYSHYNYYNHTENYNNNNMTILKQQQQQQHHEDLFSNHFVYLIQHDLAFQETIPHFQLVSTMLEYPNELRNVRFRYNRPQDPIKGPRATMIDYKQRFPMCKRKESPNRGNEFVRNHLSFYTVRRWSDNNQVASLAYYIEMFQHAIIPYTPSGTKETLQLPMEWIMMNRANENCSYWGQTILGNRINRTSYLFHLDGKRTKNVQR